jgi:allantoicase
METAPLLSSSTETNFAMKQRDDQSLAIAAEASIDKVGPMASPSSQFPRTVSLDIMSTKPPSKKQRAMSSSLSSIHASSPFLNQSYTNLISEHSSSVLFATDEWFARAENIIQNSDPVFIPDLYCPQGKVMDGWETRRKRSEGHDWCVIATNLGREQNDHNSIVNDVVGIEVDTAYFTGNQTPRISIEVANCYSSTNHRNEDEDEEWMYSWMPGAVKRLIQGGGIQGTGQTPQQVQKAEKACKQFKWSEILPMTTLRPGYDESRMHYYMLDDETRERARGFTHVRINYFPDGGVARLRLWGHTQVNHQSSSSTSVLGYSEANHSSASSVGALSDDTPIVPSSIPYHHPELSLSTNGGIGLTCSNKHYGVPDNLIRPTYGKDMGDGWETARHPDRPPILIKNPETNLIENPLMDWAVIKLGMGGAAENDGISRIIIDTKHFKGNFPESVMVEGCNANVYQSSDDDVCAATPEANCNNVEWFPLLRRTKMGPDCEHVFDKDDEQLSNCNRAVTHIRVSIFPDGGISRVRIYGQPAMILDQKSCDEVDNTVIDAAHVI